MEHLRSPNDEWRVESIEQTYYLTDLTIISGPLGARENGFETSLKPMNNKNINFWRFSKHGDEESWMRCSYSGTSLSIAQRLTAAVFECFQKNERNTKTSKTQKVVAMCGGVGTIP